MPPPALLRVLPILLLAAVLGPSPAQTQPRRAPVPPAAPGSPGDILAVRPCSELLATYAPLGPLRPRCSEMSCTSGLSLDLSAIPQGPGLYRLEVVADGQTFTCEQRLPFASCAAPQLCVWRRPGTYDGISATLVNCATAPALHAIHDIDFRGLCPSSVTARLSRGAQLLGRWQATPQYRRVVANGEGCGPRCAQGPTIAPSP